MYDDNDDDELNTTIDTSIDSAVDTAIEVAIDPTDPNGSNGSYDDLDTVELPALATVSGGMKWQDGPMSNNVEDRRSAAGKRRDQRWWDQTHAPAAIPLPPRRPPGL